METPPAPSSNINSPIHDIYLIFFSFFVCYCCFVVAAVVLVVVVIYNDGHRNDNDSLMASPLDSSAIFQKVVMSGADPIRAGGYRSMQLL